MTDSGVDTGNESSDNPVFDHSKCVLEFNLPAIPITQSGQPMPVEFLDEPHDHVGKIKCSTKARHCRLKHRYGGTVCASRNHKLRFAASTNNTELVERLLKAGADPNCSDEHKRSPLHLAACRGYVDVVRILLRHGANPNNKDTLGNTPLHLAACTNHITVVIELLDAGTDVSSHDRNGRNPIQLAQSKLKIIQMRPSGVGHFEVTRQLISEICQVVEMMLKYMKMQKADAGELESLRLRLEQVSTREQVDSEVQNLLDSLDSLKLR
ncbi:ankyrin repeat domain-containing protein 54-like isoform X4 [Bombyx mandarina]|uniref:Ankyrin repeat domain-containing protein 54 n=2 Tax=Bombyx TaxID=7090 RepID=A0A8R1WKI2_BOMMO|nr:ankyrin repeat domain-containing protein 54 [Bombyx mori]XP_028029059.1 ankyrin repeat domain-containing protein 54-like isoform X1 [Bombyx mandarina]XP_028029060.1 ankyrin repeat domain-containing protein 54-like isoform X2 [Bombyx mandarina]XP_028029061.1 ankyrin repeat domain-containing protein 54-like isoform X3 [Bombyx mandarina]XP_028029062.1 ankyrin repeat domain-containing protein 54-like isoform X4 [Bombyx mandarina]